MKRSWKIIAFVVMFAVGAFVYFAFHENKFFVADKSATSVKLPTPSFRSNTSLEEAIKNRRSVRQFKNEMITLNQVSQLLWAAQGVDAANGLRTAPSAGSTYPLEVYLVSGSVKDLSPGVYHFNPQTHSLELRAKGDLRKTLANATLEQKDVEFAAPLPRRAMPSEVKPQKKRKRLRGLLSKQTLMKQKIKTVLLAIG